MQLRRMFTAFVLMFGLSVFFLGRWATPPTDSGSQPYDGEMRILDQPRQVQLPSSTAVATPKGRRVIAPVKLSHDDVPLTALLAYQRAAGILSAVEPSCNLSWTLLAAIGRVESDHGRYGGATLGTDGVPRPQIVGVPLDGGGPVAKIHDTDNGRLDGDATWDRAVGPMQFLPTTWDIVGVDGDGDGVRSVDDIDDAALAAGIYLCAGPEGDLRDPKAMASALHRYNDSDAYVALVMAYEKRYRTGEFDVLATHGGVAEASAVLAARPLSGTPLEARGPAEKRRKAELTSAVRTAVKTAEKTGGTTPGVSTRSAQPSSPSGTGNGDAETGQPSGTGSGGATGAASGPGTTSPSGAGTTASAGDSPAGDPSTPSTTTGTTDGASTAPSGGSPSGTSTGGPSGAGSSAPAAGGEDACKLPTEPAASPSAAPDGSPTEEPTAQATCKDETTDPTEQPATCEPPCSGTPSSVP